jgi:hypothetical protein
MNTIQTVDRNQADPLLSITFPHLHVDADAIPNGGEDCGF